MPITTGLLPVVGKGYTGQSVSTEICRDTETDIVYM